VISRFSVMPRDDAYRMISVIRHWNTDRPGPR
jgi:hypothetical protein